MREGPDPYPAGARRAGPFMPGVSIGTVTKVVSAQVVFVAISDIGGDPRQAEVVEFPGTPAITTEVGGSPTHTHLARPAANQLAIGDRVICAFIRGSRDHPVVLGRLPG
jgi:hypothetical protein